MQVLILDEDPSFQAQLAQALLGHGFNVLCVDTVPGAEAFLRLGMVDVLIAGERIGGKLSHAVALLAECRNPLLAAVLRTDRAGPDLDELFDLVPSVVAILGRDVTTALVTQVVLAASAGARPADPSRLPATGRAEVAPSAPPVTTRTSKRTGPAAPPATSAAPPEPVLPDVPQAAVAASALSDAAPRDRATAKADAVPSAAASPAAASPAAVSPAAAAPAATAPGGTLPADHDPEPPRADGPLARALAAAGRTPQTRAPADLRAAPRPRAPALPAWLTTPPPGSRPAPRADAGPPAATAPAPSRSLTLPNLMPERRLHLA